MHEIINPDGSKTYNTQADHTPEEREKLLRESQQHDHLYGLWLSKSQNGETFEEFEKRWKENRNGK